MSWIVFYYVMSSLWDQADWIQTGYLYEKNTEWMNVWRNVLNKGWVWCQCRFTAVSPLLNIPPSIIHTVGLTSNVISLKRVGVKIIDSFSKPHLARITPLSLFLKCFFCLEWSYTILPFRILPDHWYPLSALMDCPLQFKLQVFNFFIFYFTFI